MQIPVNKNIDSYKDDFFKGLTLKQTVMGAVTVAAGIGTYWFFTALGLPQSISIYLLFPVGLPMAAAGLRLDGMTLAEYIRKKARVASTPLYLYRPASLELAETLNMDFGNGTSSSAKSKKENRKIMLETDEEMEAWIL